MLKEYIEQNKISLEMKKNLVVKEFLAGKYKIIRRHTKLEMK